MNHDISDKKSIKKANKTPGAVDDTEWGEVSDDNYGYQDDQERRDKRGLEDWEMVTSMSESQVSIPYWFIAIFIVLLIVAIGLTFPFWGNRPGFERPFFDWGIPMGAAWVIVMSFIIYYFVDLRYVLQDKKKKQLEEQKGNQADKDSEAS